MSTQLGETTPWVKASRSDTSGQCVETRRHDGAIEVRDSKNPEGPFLKFTSGEWAAFLDGAKKNEFDGLI